MKKTLQGSILVLLTLILGAGMAAAAVPSLPSPVAPACAAPVAAIAVPQAPTTVDLFAPEPQPAAICPLIGCVNDQYCRRDRDCTAAPGGVCNLFCPTRGCCSYP